MEKETPTPFRTLAVNAFAIALVAALAVQNLHEVCHGLAALLVGAQWRVWNLFAVDIAYGDATTLWGKLLIEANPAMVNILCGLLGAALFSRPWALRRPTLRLFLMFFGAYSLFMGFGYLMTDPLFYQPGVGQYGDWKQVIAMLGGGWGVRLPILAIGVAGWVWGFFWLGRAALQFGEALPSPSHRVRLAQALLLVPYIVINLLFTILSFWHPLGADGLFITIFQYWGGHAGFIWAFLMAAYWLKIDAPLSHVSALPRRISPAWVGLAAVAFGVAVAVLLPSIGLS